MFDLCLRVFVVVFVLRFLSVFVLQFLFAVLVFVFV